MFKIQIDTNLLIAIIIISLLIGSISIYYIRRKFNSIDKYTDLQKQEHNCKTYEDNIKDFEEAQYSLGIKDRKKPNMWKILKQYIINKIDKSA